METPWVPDTDVGKPAEDPDAWPTNLPPAPEGRIWVREENPYYTGEKGSKWIYLTQPAPSGEQEDKEDAEKKDPGFFGSLFQKAGYNWLGPGTDIAYNFSNQKWPVDALDEVAMRHDLGYKAVLDAFERGQMTYPEAKTVVSQLDDEFVRNAEQIPGFAAKLSALGMSAKGFWDVVLGPTYTGILPQNWASRAWELGTTERDEKSGFDPWQGGGPGTPGWDMPDYTGNVEIPHFGEPGYHPSKGGWVPDEPVARISVIDRDNDGIPDVLQRKKRRRRRYLRSAW